MPKKPKPQPQTAAPFYCPVKNIRKTAWSTPEYLTPADHELIKAVLATENFQQMHDVVFASDATAESFFWRVIGYPEGINYARENEAMLEKVRELHFPLLRAVADDLIQIDARKVWIESAFVSRGEPAWVICLMAAQSGGLLPVKDYLVLAKGLAQRLTPVMPLPVRVALFNRGFLMSVKADNDVETLYADWLALHPI